MSVVTEAHRSPRRRPEATGCPKWGGPTSASGLRGYHVDATPGRAGGGAAGPSTNRGGTHGSLRRRGDTRPPTHLPATGRVQCRRRPDRPGGHPPRPRRDLAPGPDARRDQPAARDPPREGRGDPPADRRGASTRPRRSWRSPSTASWTNSTAGKRPPPTNGLGARAPLPRHSRRPARPPRGFPARERRPVRPVACFRFELPGDFLEIGGRSGTIDPTPVSTGGRHDRGSSPDQGHRRSRSESLPVILGGPRGQRSGLPPTPPARRTPGDPRSSNPAPRDRRRPRPLPGRPEPRRPR